jgi:hypothetical protein
MLVDFLFPHAFTDECCGTALSRSRTYRCLRCHIAPFEAEIEPGCALRTRFSSIVYYEEMAMITLTRASHRPIVALSR